MQIHPVLLSEDKYKSVSSASLQFFSSVVEQQKFFVCFKNFSVSCWWWHQEAIVNAISKVGLSALRLRAGQVRWTSHPLSGFSAFQSIRGSSFP